MHKIQKRFMRKGLNIEKKNIKDKVFFEFKDNTIFNQYKLNNDTFKAYNLRLGYIENHNKLLKHIYNNVKKNFGIDSLPHEYNKYYNEHYNTFCIGLKHYILYRIINEDVNSEYVEIAFTNLTATNKPVLLNYLNKQENIGVQQVSTYSYTGYQGLLDAMIIVKIHKNNLNEFLYGESNIKFNDIEGLGGLNNIKKIKEFAFQILSNPSIKKINQEIQAINVLSKVMEEYENKSLANKTDEEKSSNLIKNYNEE